MEQIFFERDWSKFNKENSVLDYFEKARSDILQLDQQNVDLSIETFVKKHELNPRL